jgi:transposase
MIRSRIPLRDQRSKCFQSVSHLKDQREYDRHLYKERNPVERFISRIKQFRRVATRYEKTARNFLAFVHLESITVLWQ